MLKEDCVNTNEYFEIDFKVFSYMFWKSTLNTKDGDKVVPYSLLNGRLTFYHSIANFISEYANKIIEVSKEDYLEIQKMLSYKELYKTLYFVYTSMLGVESHYFGMMYDKITESEFYKNLSEEQKKELDKLMTKLKKFEPESKSNEALIKSYFQIAFQINDVPVLDQLHSDVYSRSSWSRKLKDLNFVVMLIKECHKKLNKQLTEKSKELVIKIKQHLSEQSNKIQISEKDNIGITKKSKPDFNETYSEFENDNDF